MSLALGLRPRLSPAASASLAVAMQSMALVSDLQQTPSPPASSAPGTAALEAPASRQPTHVLNGASLVSASSTAINNSAGYFGLGTSTPQWTLQVASSTAPQLALSDGTNNHWVFRNAGGNFYLATSSATTFATSTATALSINANGVVTVGTASTTQLYGAGLYSCQSGNVLTWSNGQFGCAVDQTSAGGNPFIWATNFNALNAATSSVLWHSRA